MKALVGTEPVRVVYWERGVAVSVIFAWEVMVIVSDIIMVLDIVVSVTVCASTISVVIVLVVIFSVILDSTVRVKTLGAAEVMETETRALVNVLPRSTELACEEVV